MLRVRISLRPRTDGAPASVTRSPTTTALGSAPRLRITAIDAVSASHSEWLPSAFVTSSRIWPCGLRHEIDLMTPVTSIVCARIEDPRLAVVRGGDAREPGHSGGGEHADEIDRTRHRKLPLVNAAPPSAALSDRF